MKSTTVDSFINSQFYFQQQPHHTTPIVTVIPPPTSLPPVPTFLRSAPIPMEATAAAFSSASLSRALASSPLTHRRRSRVRVPDRRKRPSGVVVAAAASTGNYVVPLDAAPSGITRPLVEILRDLNKRVPETIVLPASRRASASDPVIPWYHANRMLSFYAPGWCGEVRDVIYNDNGKVTVVYRVTIRGIDGQVHREAAGIASLSDARLDDPVAAAEEAAFCKACARFGFGLYLYHEDEVL